MWTQLLFNAKIYQRSSCKIKVTQTEERRIYFGVIDSRYFNIRNPFSKNVPNAIAYSGLTGLI